MLVRDAPHLEVFMLRRSPRAVFGPGAYVFPGGAVDDGDRSVPITGREPSSADLLMSREGALRWWAAAAREVFEESGFLLAAAPVPADLDDARTALNRGERSFVHILGEHGTSVAGDSMYLFSHWLTPVGPPRRYDTWFLAALAPDGQVGTHDNTETVDSEWVRPAEMLDRWRNDQIDLIFPTMRTLRVLENFDSAAALIDELRQADSDAAVEQSTPWLIDDASGERVALGVDERGDARRQWRQLASSWEGDADLERADYAAKRTGTPDRIVTYTSPKRGVA